MSDPKPDEVTVPTCCPVCRSPNVTAQGKRVDASTYWRCRACGEIWNAARRGEADRYPRWRH